MLQISRAVEKGDRPPIQVMPHFPIIYLLSFIFTKNEQEETPIGMEKRERSRWWNIIQKCCAQDPHARPPMEIVAKMLLDLHTVLYERIQGEVFYLSNSQSKFCLIMLNCRVFLSGTQSWQA
jgi:hypothetical protein